MNFNEYQDEANKTAIYPESGQGTYAALSYAALGLSNEAGEVGGKVKKIWRDDFGQVFDDRRAAILDEVGDVLWYAAAVASELGVTLESVAAANVAKLKDRQKRNVLGGSGDSR